MEDSPFTASQAEIVKNVANNGAATVVAPSGLTNVSGLKFASDNSIVRIISVEKLTINQKMEMRIQ